MELGAPPVWAFDVQTLMPIPANRQLPQFVLPPINSQEPGFSSADLAGEVVIVNIFASWCSPCREEHGVLMDLSDRGVPIFGVNYKDTPVAARHWLQTLGSPYRRTGADRNGRIAESMDLRGLPQTMVVDTAGRIAYVQVGAVTNEDAHDIILPLIARLRQEAP